MFIEYVELGNGIAPKFEGLKVIPSRSAFRELCRQGMTIADAIRVLEEGFDCEVSPRKKEVLEKCVRKGRKMLKVVAVKSFNYSMNCECWLLLHVGIF
ncbi:MAG: hypothetical protein V1847_01570 [Candidatus Diapherotrites archaeon]